MNHAGLDNAISEINTRGSSHSVASTQPSNEMGQADFIELLVAQVKNQDPSKPMEPSQFMNQLAQFSTVNGVQELKNSFDTLADKLSSDRSLQATNLVGRDVLVPGNHGLLNASGAINGQINLPEQASEVILKISNSRGALVRSLPLGAHDGGSLQFQWDGLADDGSSVIPGSYKVVAEAFINGAKQAVEVELETRVDSITLSKDGAGTLLNLASGKSVPLSFIQQIK